MHYYHYRQKLMLKKEEINIKKDISNIEARKEYYKNWRKKNKDKIKKHNETFWKKQAEKLNNKEQ